MTNEDIKKKFGLIVEEEWINKWGSEVFPRLEYTKHEDKYNKVDAQLLQVTGVWDKNAAEDIQNKLSPYFN